jgi:hypothetical protein
LTLQLLFKNPHLWQVKSHVLLLKSPNLDGSVFNVSTSVAPQERSLQSAGCREASLLWDEVTKVMTFGPPGWGPQGEKFTNVLALQFNKEILLG